MFCRPCVFMKWGPILGKRPAGLSMRLTIRLNPKLVGGGKMMLNVEIRVGEKPHEVSLSSFAETILREIRAVVREEICHVLAGQASKNPESSQRTNSEIPPQAVSIKEAARLLSISPRTVQNYISLKTIPTIRIGRRVLIPMKGMKMIASRGLREKRN